MTDGLAPVVVGVDGSVDSQRALDYGVALAAGLDAETIAVRAVPAAVTPGDTVVEGRGRRIPLRVVEGPPAPALLAAADAEDARLVVVGRRGEGGFPDLLLGSTSHHVARLARRPVLVVPAGSDPRLPGPGAPLVVGVEGSPGSHVAVRGGAEVAAAYESEVTGGHALDLAPTLIFGAEGGDTYRRARQVVEGMVADWCEPLRKAGVVHRALVEEGGAALGLIRATQDSGAALLVVGSRGAGGFPGLRLGSVADPVAHNANVPVVIVPPDD
jgi:nucleotide-binding universal stress UspA family protein